MSPFDKKRTLWPTLDRSALDPNAQANFNIDILNNNHDRLSANRQQTGFGKYALTCPCKHDEMNKGQGLVCGMRFCPTCRFDNFVMGGPGWHLVRTAEGLAAYGAVT